MRTGHPLPENDVAVVGAGVIGVACAYTLARSGLRVLLLDRQEPGQGASFGNAGHLATEQVFPIADLSILRRLPAMLSDPLGPLRLNWRYAPRALPWFMRLLLNLRPAPLQKTIAGLRALNERSLRAWLALLEAIGRPGLFRRDGSLLVYERPDSLPAVQALQARLRGQGVTVDAWQAGAVRDAAPRLHEQLQGGLFFPDTGHFIDPHRVVCELFSAATERGARFLRGRVQGGRLQEEGVSLATDHGTIHARQVLIACGAHSRALTATLTGRHVPLDTERGYHLMLPHEHKRLPFAVTSFERRFIMTPMSAGLRLAGTVEFAGLECPPSMERAWQLARLADGMFGQALDTSGATAWMGCRPSLPDSLPVIDRVCHGRVLLAFGHHHLGLTQAAVTAEAIARLAGGRGEAGGQPDPLALDLYRLDRF